MPPSEEHLPQVGQASGMVSVQAGCTIDEALVLMKERAQATDQRLAEIAAAIVERRIRFGPAI